MSQASPYSTKSSRGAKFQAFMMECGLRRVRRSSDDHLGLPSRHPAWCTIVCSFALCDSGMPQGANCPTDPVGDHPAPPECGKASSVVSLYGDRDNAGRRRGDVVGRRCQSATNYVSVAAPSLIVHLRGVTSLGRQLLSKKDGSGLYSRRIVNQPFLGSV